MSHKKDARRIGVMELNTFCKGNCGRPISAMYFLDRQGLSQFLSGNAKNGLKLHEDIF